MTAIPARLLCDSLTILSLLTPCSYFLTVTAAIQSTKSLSATVKRYKERNKTLNRLQHELEDLTTVLSSLKEAADSDKSISTLLNGSVHRCIEDEGPIMHRERGRVNDRLQDLLVLSGTGCLPTS